MKHTLLSALALVSLTAQAADLPAAIQAPAGQQLASEAHAKGVQIYDCKASKDDAAKFEWVFRAPEAELYDAAGKALGKHYAGPSWESSDGSKVVGEVKARDAGPDANAIPWLLLAAKANSGSGAYAKTMSIQRVNTVAGKAPASGCTAAQAGQELRVPYQALYYFYNAKP